MHALDADITIPPHSVNVSLNEVAEFNCTGVANTFFWKANTLFLSNNGNEIFISPIIALDHDIRMSTLKVKVSSVDNATNITCSAITLTTFIIDESEPALLLVQGIKNISIINA